MSGRSQAHARPSESTFELDRFELVGEQYEVEGRWSGVRGRVFIRPELTLNDGSQSRRLLADLAQKPWQAADGDRWAVAFPCRDEGIDVIDAELTVAPDITVPVKRGRGRTRAGGRKAATPGPSPRTRGTEKPRAAAEVKSAAGTKRRGLGVQLAEAQGELEQLRNEQSRLLERLDAEARRADAARAERDRAIELGEQLAAERDDAIRSRDEARAERDHVYGEAASGHEAVQRDREKAIGELAQANAKLEHASAALQAMTAERDSAIRAGVEVERELEAANTERVSLLADREQLIAQPDVAPVEMKPSFEWNEPDGWRRSRHGGLLNRVVAVLALAAAVIVVLVLVLVVF